MGTLRTFESNIIAKCVAQDCLPISVETCESGNFSHSYVSIAAFNVLRIHSETVCFLTFAAPVTFLKSSAVKRTCTAFPLAAPLGSLGRPTFFGLGWLGIAELLNDGRADCGYGRDSWGDMQDGNMAGWLGWIVRLVRPGIGRIRFRMAVEVEHFDYAIPDCLTLKNLFDRDALAVRGFRAVHLVDRVPEFFDIGQNSSLSLLAEKHRF